MLDNRLEQRLHVVVRLVNFAKCISLFRAGINDREIELFVGSVQLDKEIEDHVQDLMRTCVLPIYFVNYDNRTSMILQRLAQDKFSLSLLPIMRVHHEEHTVDHFH